MSYISWQRVGRWPVNAFFCALLLSLDFPLSDNFARNAGVTAEVVIEKCETTLRVIETYRALDQPLGSPRIRTFPLAGDSDDTPPAPFSGPVFKP